MLPPNGMGRLKAMPPRVASVGSRIAVPAKVPDPFYEGIAWREFIRAIKVQRGYVCEVVTCRKDCSGNHRGLIGDHIVERKDARLGQGLSAGRTARMVAPTSTRPTSC